MTARLCFAVPLTLLALTACSQPQTAANRANQETIAACRERAEDVYVRQNRDLLYQNDTSSTPYSAGPNTGIPTHGLSSLFAHERVVDDCVRNTGSQEPRTDSTVGGGTASGSGAGAIGGEPGGNGGPGGSPTLGGPLTP